MDENGRKCAKMSNTLCRLEIDPGRGGTHSADRKSTQDVAEHTQLTGNLPRTWRNTLCRPKSDLGRGGTHSADRKSTLTFIGGEGL